MLSDAALKELRHIKGGAHGISESPEARSPQMAAALYRKGLVDRTRQGEYDYLTEKRRSYFMYRLTNAGREALKPDPAP